jgi:hypothetical protein
MVGLQQWNVGEGIRGITGRMVMQEERRDSQSGGRYGGRYRGGCWSILATGGCGNCDERIVWERAMGSLTV